MIILSKKRFCFVNPEAKSRDEAERFTTKGGMAIEDAPDWIEKDPLYQWAVDDGDLVVVKSKSAKDEAMAMAEATKVKDEAVAKK